MKTRLGILAVAAALVALFAVAASSSSAATSCTSHARYITHRKHVSCDSAKKVYNKYYNAKKLPSGWKCKQAVGSGYDYDAGDCKKRNSAKQVVAKFHFDTRQGH